MTFISIEYIVFLPVICVLYAVIPGNFRWVWLLIVSYAFYATWKASYLLVVLVLLCHKLMDVAN
jgi:alginate O-acetyltransferase complex protein AlgI